MADAETPVIWLVDENAQELKTYHAILGRILGPDVEVKPLPARPQRADYLPILRNPRTASLIIDERLKETGVADHQGIELAQFLRAVDPKLPIYILTNYPDEFYGNEESVEYILAKEEVRNPDRHKVIAARILRRVNVYHDILDEREARFRGLLRKSLSNVLSEKELGELEELQLQRSSPILAEELAQLRQLHDVVMAQKRLLDALKCDDEGKADHAE